jgi:hypothetical protein
MLGLIGLPQRAAQKFVVCPFGQGINANKQAGRFVPREAGLGKFL